MARDASNAAARAARLRATGARKSVKDIRAEVEAKGWAMCKEGVVLQALLLSAPNAILRSRRWTGLR